MLIYSIYTLCFGRRMRIILRPTQLTFHINISTVYRRSLIHLNTKSKFLDSHITFFILRIIAKKLKLWSWRNISLLELVNILLLLFELFKTIMPLRIMLISVPTNPLLTCLAPVVEDIAAASVQLLQLVRSHE